MTKKVCQAGDPQRKGRLKSTLRRERSTPYFDRPKKISVQVIIQVPDHLVPFFFSFFSFSFFSFLFSRSWLSPEIGEGDFSVAKELPETRVFRCTLYVLYSTGRKNIIPGYQLPPNIQIHGHADGLDPVWDTRQRLRPMIGKRTCHQ